MNLPTRRASTSPAARARGADFSSFQSDAAVKAAIAHGLDFGIVKVSQGTGYVNPRLRAQVRLLYADRAVVGLYHFLEPHVDGAAQWDHFERAASEGLVAGLHRALLAVDHEPLNGVLPADSIARAFIKRGQARGYRVGRYGSAGVTMNRNLGEDWRWVAKWGNAPPAGRWDVWQFSDGGGKQDWNVFRGDRAQLLTWSTTMMPAKPRPRWWLHDVAAGRTLGPYRLARLGPALVYYAARHRSSRRYKVERT